MTPEIKEMDYAELELRVLAQHPRKCTVWSTPTVSAAEADRLFRAFNPAGNNQIEKAHFLKLQGLIEVEPRLKEYEPYDYWLLGASRRGYRAIAGINTHDQKLASGWHSMMQRCYDTSARSYTSYGAKGVSVCKRWHTCTNYIEDVKLLHGWASKKADWAFELDKDYYSSNQYSQDTCMWLSSDENASMRGTPVVVTDCYGVSTGYLSLGDCARHLKISKVAVRNNLGATLTKGARAGWKFEYLESKYPLRRQLK